MVIADLGSGFTFSATVLCCVVAILFVLRGYFLSKMMKALVLKTLLITFAKSQWFTSFALLSPFIFRKLAGCTLFITGASRGIGKAIALKAAKDGANIVIAAKTAEPHPTLSGTIYTAAAESKL